MTNKNLQRLPLRELLTHIERRCREMTEHIQMDLGPAVADFTKICRPKRKHSAFPSVRTLVNTHDRFKRSLDYAREITQRVDECVEAVEQRVKSV